MRSGIPKCSRLHSVKPFLTALRLVERLRSMQTCRTHAYKLQRISTLFTCLRGRNRGMLKNWIPAEICHSLLPQRPASHAWSWLGIAGFNRHTNSPYPNQIRPSPAPRRSSPEVCCQQLFLHRPDPSQVLRTEEIPRRKTPS